MSAQLTDVLRGGRAQGAPRVWLKASGFCKQLLLGEAGDPWVGAAEYLAYFSQAHRLLAPDVAVVEVGDLYESWVTRHPGLLAEMGSKRRPSFPLRKLLEQVEPRVLLAEVLAAVGAHVRGQVPIVLAMPAPRRWLERASRLVGRGELELDRDSVEEAAMYVADLLRSISTAPVTGVLLEESSVVAAESETDMELCRPVVNLAKHYHWSLVLRSASRRRVDPPSLADFDALIASEAKSDAQISIGLDITKPLLQGQAVPAVGDHEFYFAEIPAGLRPESVLEALARLRS